MRHAIFRMLLHSILRSTHVDFHRVFPSTKFQIHFERFFSITGQMIHGIDVVLIGAFFYKMRSLFAIRPAPSLALLWRFLLSSTYFSHVAFLLTFVTHFDLEFTARGIVVSTAALATLGFAGGGLISSSTLLTLVSLLGVLPPISIRFFEAISVAVAISTAFSNASSCSANSLR